jgi:hypothetical protein
MTEPALAPATTGATPRPSPGAIVLLDDPGPVGPAETDGDPAAVILTCANCGAQLDERKCKLICACGYFLSCSDYC